MEDLRSTSSTLAIVESWNQRQRAKNLERVPIDWAEHYFPPRMFYLRPLSVGERYATEYDGSREVMWYGIFNARQAEPVMVSAETVSLFQEAKEWGAELCYLH